MRKRVRYVLLGVAAIALLAAGGVILEFVVLRGATPAISATHGIAALEKQRIGGVEQWVLIRGHDRTRPVLLFLHGGPGMPAMFLAHAFQRELERDFVVVHWDRRGAGKSFSAGVQKAGLSVSQTLEDTYELTRSLRTRFGQRRIYLLGHSWGSYLGLLAIQRHPEYYAAFIGMGQLAGTRQEVEAQRRAFIRQAARKSGDSMLLAKTAGGSEAITEDDLFRFGGELYASRSFWPILKTGLGAPEYTLRDALNVKKGADLVSREMRYDVTPRPLDGEIDKVGIPVFLLLGRHDFNTPSELAMHYLDRLDAPLKGLVWFEESAHFPFFEQPALFHAEIIRAAEAVARFWEDQTDNDHPSAPPIGVGSLQQAERQFVNASCHVAFRYPATWTVQPDTTQQDQVCVFQLRAAAWDSLLIEADSVQNVHTIHLAVLTEPFEEVLPMSAFERRDGSWVVGGRAGLESLATEIEGRGWRGVQGDAPVGCYRLGGGYVGACEVPMALIAAGTYTIVVEGGPGTWEIFDRVLATLEIRQ